MTHQGSQRVQLAALIVLVAACMTGCLERELKPLNPCLVSGVDLEVRVANIDKVDLLFMVDNSQSMKDEQAALAEEFPRLIRVLATGDRDEDGTPEFTPVKNLHLGVVSSDLGLPGVPPLPDSTCIGVGDDGQLQNRSNPMIMGCSAATFSPPFLTYNQAQGGDPMQLATDFSCIATLGVDGCGFEQQLESVLKAVWPGNDPSTTFVGEGMVTTGNAGPGFPNGDFIRSDSLIAIVLVTDEEDCSSRELDHFALDYSDEGLNTRCYHEGQLQPSRLFAVERYIQSLKKLRPGQENLVIFAGIVGVPQRLVTPEAMAAVDIKQPAQLAAFFDGILADPEMQERIDDRGTADKWDDRMQPSCNRGGDDQRAYPPRRIVQVAKGFGANGVIQSICQDDFRPAIDAIISAIAAQLGDVCLPRPLVPNKEGLVECNVIWELPKEPVGDTPLRCDQLPFLSLPDVGRSATGEDGGAACKVNQLAVLNATAPTAGEGWYYDDFSEKTQVDCKANEKKQRITFTPGATPPTGVTVKLECLNETQSLATTRTDLAPDKEQPSVGDPCDDVMLRGQSVTGDAACVALLAQPVDGSIEDRSMFCHLGSRVCVQRCSTQAECPPAWVCDTRPENMAAAGGAYCVNPTCGSSQD